MPPTFQANQASVRRWIIDDLERSLRFVTKANGASFDLAVSLNTEQVRAASAKDAQGPGAVLNIAEAKREGMAIAHVVAGEDQPANEVSGRMTVLTPMIVVLELPPESEWAGRRLHDVADAIDRDVIAAVMFDRQRGGAALATDHGGGGAPAIDPTLGDGVFVIERQFNVRWRHRVESLQSGAPAGEPTAPSKRTVFTLYRDPNLPFVADYATVEVGDNVLTRRENGSAIPVAVVNRAELADHTIATLRAEIASISGWLVDDVDADFDDAPAEQIEAFEAVTALGAGNKVAIEVLA